MLLHPHSLITGGNDVKQMDVKLAYTTQCKPFNADGRLQSSAHIIQQQCWWQVSMNKLKWWIHIRREILVAAEMQTIAVISAVMQSHFALFFFSWSQRKGFDKKV
jgi:hypothetical protein